MDTLDPETSQHDGTEDAKNLALRFDDVVETRVETTRKHEAPGSFDTNARRALADKLDHVAPDEGDL